MQTPTAGSALAATPSTVQTLLGDDEAAEQRLSALREDVAQRLEALGRGGIEKPPHW